MRYQWRSKMKKITLDGVAQFGVLLGCPIMNHRKIGSLRSAIPSASMVCRTHLASLRDEWRAAYVRRHYTIRQLEPWRKIIVLYTQAILSYFSLQILRCLMPLPVPDSWRTYHLEVVLAFCEQ